MTMTSFQVSTALKTKTARLAELDQQLKAKERLVDALKAKLEKK